ncbi:hypothetical protein CHLRE_02g086500v5 [Chlamydomonas reinhardtii]|uniref:Uncharacterized protein n=1 Tax=Chlamydomonas reinhardtii TaxID=3055 RepID=A0A2K3E0Y7_CHLRE|nr:uncharacterized protein CHLRE_02g086500v5 [Chlamydomonas reinhardtii]PNW86442.1 hypothetical protein CHLRE_02g086500v5 [Chlamydomonas reinhardtii]
MQKLVCSARGTRSLATTTCRLPRVAAAPKSVVAGCRYRKCVVVRCQQVKTKTLHLMRHGTTEMNEYLSMYRYDAENFSDPMLYDTVLSPRGRAGAQAAAKTAARLQPEPELLVVSPLTRALQTAQLAFLPHYQGPILVEPLARERVWHASDIGSGRDKLQATFPEGRYDFSDLPDVWWYTVDPSNPRAVGLEPEDVFKERVMQFKRWLGSRPEETIAVVAHWGLLYELTSDGDSRGAEFENCQLRSYTLKVPLEAGSSSDGEGQSSAQVPVLRERMPNLLSALFR